MSGYKFTFVIGFRYKADRISLLRRTLDWINTFNGVEVILVEQDKHSKIGHLDLKCKHIFLKSDKPYNRSWAFNVALRRSNSNIIVFGDSDLIIEHNQFISGIKALEKYDMVSPYDKVIDLTPQESSYPTQNILEIDRDGRGENDNQKINISGGVAMFKKESIIKIGGWNEDFIGWGAEDDEITIRVKKYLKWCELKGPCYHMYHDRPAPDRTNYNHNINLLNSVIKLTDEQRISMINKMAKNSGLINRFDD
jgi:predicted glycosyltransferase involved in capsule biosynthesis|tara:strand:- start:172 stop:927 length:756 start_codon:yes stop_codon:yes gene_type:complete